MSKELKSEDSALFTLFLHYPELALNHWPSWPLNCYTVFIVCKISLISNQQSDGVVGRALDCGSQGHGFESGRGHKDFFKNALKNAFVFQIEFVTLQIFRIKC